MREEYRWQWTEWEGPISICCSCNHTGYIFIFLLSLSLYFILSIYFSKTISLFLSSCVSLMVFVIYLCLRVLFDFLLFLYRISQHSPGSHRISFSIFNLLWLTELYHHIHVVYFLLRHCNLIFILKYCHHFYFPWYF